MAARWIIGAMCVFVLTACGGDDTADNAAGADATPAQATTATPTPEESAEPASSAAERPPTSAHRTTTTVGRTATTELTDPLTQAVTAAGFDPPTGEVRDSVNVLCDAFNARDAAAINDVAKLTERHEYLRIAFGVVCSGNEQLVGVVVMPSGDPVFPFFPRIVEVGTIDERVASWFEGKLVDGQVVALAPGVYTPYNPNVPDLTAYLTLPNDGDCVMRATYFPDSGGACWNGVQPGSAEQ